MQTILLVDDDRSILVAWKRVLQLEGYRVETASNGEDGLEAARSVQPVLIVTDRSMPGMDGIEMCRQLKRDAKLEHVVVVLASAGPDIPYSKPAWNEFWQKPVAAETMVASIRRLLGSSP
jgi:CheY-like chemotaxis protein